MDYFSLQTREKNGKKKKRKEKKMRKEKQSQGMDSLSFVWNYECLNGILKFYVKVHAIVWLGACPKPRVVRISS